MLKINRLKVVVKTNEGLFGFDNKFDKKINFIASYTNTKGKSSCIEAIYYCLGLEELIGGKNEKALKPVFRDKFQYNKKEINVLETEFYLEIRNSKDDIKTILRTACKESQSPNLIRVYDGKIDDAREGTCKYEDMYVHLSGSASKSRGFHKFLESFMDLNLPNVPSYDDANRKLYLQVIFSAIFIEQKRGWAGLFATTPTYLRIREPQKRTVEFLIGLESLSIEEKKQECKDLEIYIKKEWELLFNNINIILSSDRCSIENISLKPEIIEDEKLIPIYKILEDGNKVQIEKFILDLEERLKKLELNPDNVGKNISVLEKQLYAKQDELLELEEKLIEEKRKYIYEKENINDLKENLKNVELDLESNKDVIKIKNLGSTKDWSINKDICPTCNQTIQDILLPQSNNIKVMSIEENIKHLEAQKSMLQFSIKTYKSNAIITDSNINMLEKSILEYRRLLRAIKNDLYSVDSSASEAIIREKIFIKNTVDNLNDMLIKIKDLCDKIRKLSKQWEKLLEIKSNLPSSKFSLADKTKINTLKNSFISNLKLFGYNSIGDISKVEISEDKLMPIVNGFDIKFDSSASDSVRVIWAFTLALMQTSINKGGNHPKILIFDEPGQQSMVVHDLCNFIKSLCDLNNETQIIMGITMDDTNVRKTIQNIDKSVSNLIIIDDRSIIPIN